MRHCARTYLTTTDLIIVFIFILYLQSDLEVFLLIRLYFYLSREQRERVPQLHVYIYAVMQGDNCH